jgi:hypothetical protein
VGPLTMCTGYGIGPLLFAPLSEGMLYRMPSLWFLLTRYQCRNLAETYRTLPLSHSLPFLLCRLRW